MRPNRWFRGQRRDLEARRDALAEAARRPQPDLEEAVERALGYLGRFREVIAQGTLVERKEFLGGFLREIRLDPGTLKGEIRFYDLVAASFWLSGWTGQKLYGASGQSPGPATRSRPSPDAP